VLALADAIEHAHRCGVIHRDLKPSNILLQDYSASTPLPEERASKSGKRGASSSAAWPALNLAPKPSAVPKITDFGIAKKLNDVGQTNPGAIVGSPSHMSPEQAAGDDVGPLCDVYSLGATLYECLTGRPPFRAATLLETLTQVRQQEPVSPRHLQP